MTKGCFVIFFTTIFLFDAKSSESPACHVFIFFHCIPGNADGISLSYVEDKVTSDWLIFDSCGIIVILSKKSTNTFTSRDLRRGQR